MKKRLLSFMTALVMIAGFCIPVSASGIAPEDLGLIPVDVKQGPIIKTADDNIFVQEIMETGAKSSPEGVDEEGSVYAIRDWATPQSLKIEPLIKNVLTGDLYSIDGTQRSMVWTDNAQFQGLRLSPSAVNEILSPINEVLGLLSDEYIFYGWWMETTLYLTATLPRRVKYKQSFSHSSQVFETKAVSIPYQATVLTISDVFEMPSGLDPTTTYSMSFTGAFYYLYSTGPNINKEGSISFSSGVTMNSTI